MFAKLGVLALAAGGLLLGAGIATRSSQSAITGDYVEVRSCDVYTGSCFANAEMNLVGREAIMAWSIKSGAFNGVKLDGLKVIAVVQADGTLGDVNRFPQPARSVLIVDEAANSAQREALVHFAQKRAAAVLGNTVQVQAAPVAVELPPTCSKAGCANVRAGDLVEIETRCL